jgi:Transcription termination factor nusG
MHLAHVGRAESFDRAGGNVDRSAGRADGCGGPDFFPCGDVDLKGLMPITMRSQWFVIHTLSGQEQKVKESIEKRIKTEEMGE